MRLALQAFTLCAALVVTACAAGPIPGNDVRVEVRTDFPAGSQLAEVSPPGDSVRVRIVPEAEPINPSPWYALSITAERSTDLDLVLDYGRYRHRYRPWISRTDGGWELVADDRVSLVGDGEQARIRLVVSAGDTVVAAQPIVDGGVYEAWYEAWFAHNPGLVRETVGQSSDGRDLDAFTLLADEPRSDRPLLIILGRQHPPEVTGAFALDGFVQAALRQSANASLPFDLVILPLLNPDGVALGYWRMNTSGLDLNRDWLLRGEAETQAAWTYLQSLGLEDRDRVVMIDFHSTRSDRLYLDQYGAGDWRGGLLDAWLADIRNRGGDATPEPRVTQSEGGNTAKAVFANEIGALALTWETGDNTLPAAASDAGATGFDALMASWH